MMKSMTTGRLQLFLYSAHQAHRTQKLHKRSFPVANYLIRIDRGFFFSWVTSSRWWQEVVCNIFHLCNQRNIFWKGTDFFVAIKMISRGSNVWTLEPSCWLWEFEPPRCWVDAGSRCGYSSLGWLREAFCWDKQGSQLRTIRSNIIPLSSMQ